MFVEFEKRRRNWNLLISIIAVGLMIWAFFSIQSHEKSQEGTYIALLLIYLSVAFSHAFLSFYYHKYYLSITNDTLSIKTLFGTQVYNLQELQNFKTKKAGKTTGQFILFWENEQKSYVYTTQGHEFWNLLDKQLQKNAEGHKAKHEYISVDNEIALKGKKPANAWAQKISYILIIIFSIFSLLAFFFVGYWGEIAIFDTYGLIRYFWLLWLPIPFGVFTYVFGFILNGEGYSPKANVIIACVMIPILFVLGLLSITEKNSYAIEPVRQVVQKTGVDLPIDIKVITVESFEEKRSYVKIVNKEQRKQFMERTDSWKKQLPLKIESTVLQANQLQLTMYDCFLCFNEEFEQINMVPEGQGEYTFIIIACDYETGGICVLHNLKVYIP